MAVIRVVWRVGNNSGETGYFSNQQNLTNNLKPR
jgi:hypothetical protein